MKHSDHCGNGATRPILCGETSTNSFQITFTINRDIKKTNHYNQSRNSQIESVASNKGLETALEQQVEPGVLASFLFRSRFQNPAQQKNSTNELELLPVVVTIFLNFS